MGPGVGELAPLVVMLVVILGPLLVLIGLLNLRDRRVEWLSSTAWAEFAPRLRSEVAIRVRCALLSRRSDVIVDTRGCVSEPDIWPVLMRLRRNLPTDARLTVEGGHGNIHFGWEATSRSQRPMRRRRSANAPYFARS
ncbi:MAG: hypothetical protein ACRELA_04040 [Candidatus Rokuibacteriota bacterium]